MLLTSCELFSAPTPPAPLLTVTPSVTQGEAPLEVTFTATLESATTRTFRWTVGTVVQPETAEVFTTTFERPGVYIVGAAAVGVADSVSLRVGGESGAEPVPEDLSLSSTPGGPAPWAVRYTAAPAETGLEARCREGAAFRRVEGGVFACVHEPGDTVQARYLTDSGEVAVAAEMTPNITEVESVAFAGVWRYSARGQSETFTISEGDETEGLSPDGRFKLFTVGQREGLIVEFTIEGQTVVLTPTPDNSGRQLYQGEVYDLMLEPLPVDSSTTRR